VSLSRAGIWLADWALGVRLTDPMTGYFVMRRDFYMRARPRLSGVGFKILVDLVASVRPRPRVVERMTALRPRQGGTSKLDVRVVADLMALLAEKRLGGLLRGSSCSPRSASPAWW
jgi:dolichol-phosphate mannosyltransferase